MFSMEKLFGNSYKLSKSKNDLNKALYQTYYTPWMPVTNTRNLTNDITNGYMDNDITYSIINKISDTASNIPLKLIDQNGDEIKNHWVLDILNNPNDDDSIKDILYNYYVYLLSIGNSYIYTPKLDSGRSTELWTMPSDLIEVISGPWYEPITGYKIIEGDQEIIFPKENVLHGKLFNPKFNSGSWVYGLSPIKVAAQTINALNAGQISQEAAYKNMGPPYIISSETPEGLTPEQQEMLEDTIKKKYSGANNFNKPMITGTPVNLLKIGVSPVDLDIINGSEHGLRILCNIYGVSSVLFNDNANSTYNNISQARKDFYDYTIKPMNKNFSLKLKKFLIPNENLKFEFDYSNVEVLQESFNTKIDSLSKATFLTDNEKREFLGYKPIEGGDNLKVQNDKNSISKNNI